MYGCKIFFCCSKFPWACVESTLKFKNKFGHAPSKRFASHAIVHVVYSFKTPVHFMVTM
jgi:hypothetical protein